MHSEVTTEFWKIYKFLQSTWVFCPSHKYDVQKWSLVASLVLSICHQQPHKRNSRTICPADKLVWGVGSFPGYMNTLGDPTAMENGLQCGSEPSPQLTAPEKIKRYVKNFIIAVRNVLNCCFKLLLFLLLLLLLLQLLLLLLLLFLLLFLLLMLLLLLGREELL